MVDGTQSALAQQLAALGIKPEDVQAAVMLLVATARGQTETLVRQGNGGILASSVDPLPSAEKVRKLDERLASVELRLKETNEKLDRVLAALEKK
ncbi:hypothetical protein [Pyxidicoccus sp. MSG2]|uniref:hypothetical protein n=1 Tax=Pyxidicoccus sp. MSG2 TaxID=2996790 RepID=UPI00226E1ACF|nr:hypothetical protein [Pyxidicoccus sp. MSG2]MCY1018250.1 hypothetical protein [Pyxidicoccus sp. MSG2]